MSFQVVDAGLRTRLLSLMLVVAMAASLLVAPPGAMADDRDPAQLALACPDPLPDAPFNDVAAGNVHARAIACLVAYGVTEGQGPNTYGPTTTVVRAQMATFLARLLSQTDTSLPTPASPVFTDVDGVHADNIEALAATGIVQGTSATTFSPGGEVNRAQMATFLNRLLAEVGVELPDAAPDFSDVDGGVHAPAIGTLAAAGVVLGTGPNTFNPGGVVTREQMASFLMRATDLMVAADVTSPPYLDGDDADNGVPEDDDATPGDDDAAPGDDDDAEGQELQPGVATGECRDPEVLLAESGSIDVSGEVDTFDLQLEQGQRISIRPEDFSFNMRYRLIDVFEENLISETDAASIRTVPETATYQLRIYDRRGGTGSYGLSIFDVTDATCQVSLSGLPWNLGDTPEVDGTGSLEVPGAYHSYTFDLQAGQRISVRPEDFPFNMRYRLVDGFREDLIGETDATAIRTIQETATYELLVFNRRTGTGSYGISLFDVTAPERVETVDRFPYERTADSPDVGSGTLSVPGAYHAYDLELDAGQRISFRPDDFPFNMRWRLLDSDGNQVFGETDATTIRTVEEAGTYRLVVFNRRTGTGSYRFSLFDVTAPERVESIDGYPYERTLDEPDIGSGTLSVPGAFHAYDLEAAAGQRISFRADDFPFNVRWRLVDSDGNHVFGETDRTTSVTFDTAGTYRLLIFNRRTGTGSYRFSLFDVTGQ